MSDKKTIHDYSVAVMASHNVTPFLAILLDSLERLHVDPTQVYVGDAGFTVEEIEELKDLRKVNLVDLPVKNQGRFKTQSPAYKKIINNRISFLNGVKNLRPTRDILQLDADTAVVKEQFPGIDPKAQLILTVRKDADYIKKFKKHKDAYPNLGVAFWRPSKRTDAMWKKWAKIRKIVPDNTGQYEQNTFLHAMNEDEYFLMHVQKLPCEKYNCYKPEWLTKDPCIIHFKGMEGRDRSGKNPNPELLRYVLGETNEQTESAPSTGCPELGLVDQE